MLSCRDITELATEHDDGAMSARRGLSFRLHLVMCGHCRRYVKQLRDTTAALRSLRVREPGLSAEAQESLVSCFRQSLVTLD